MIRLCAMALATTVAAGSAMADWQFTVGSNGTVALQRSGRTMGTLTPGLFASGWRGAQVGAAAAYPEEEDVPRTAAILSPDGVRVRTALRAERVDGGLRLVYSLVPEADIKLNSLHITLDLPEHAVAGATFAVDGEEGAFPPVRGATHLRGSAPASAVRLAWSDGARLDLAFQASVPVLVQDNRQWGPSFCVRIGPQMDGETVWPKDRELELGITLTTAPGATAVFEKPVVIRAGDAWVPLAVELDVEPGSAVDFSVFRPTGAPAGKDGWLISAPGGFFAFATSPDVPRRFYGVNFCFTGQYLEKDEAERLAERLMRLGYNAVRVHHHEGTLADRSAGDSTTMRPERLDQLDYFLAQLKQRGLYITTDLFVSRTVFAAEVWPGETGDVAMDEFKMAVLVNDNAFANLATWTRTFLGHRNPYTGMRYADDPALAWISFVNEGNPGNFIRGLSERCRRDWLTAWNAWLKATYADAGALAAAWGRTPEGDFAVGTIPMPGSLTADAQDSRDLSAFVAETHRRFFRRLRTIVRDELGSQALLTDLNGWTNVMQSQVSRVDFDYVDDHFYVDHPQFIERSWRLPSRCPNTSPVATGAPGGRHTAFVRLLDKPFTISEYNYSGPGRYRGVGGILTGCMAALQDWSVLWRFAYSHSRNNLFAPSTAGYFDLVTDPLNQVAERAGLCLFLRGDMAPAGRTVAITMNEADLRSRRGRQGGLAPGWSPLVSVAKVGTFVGASAAAVPADLVLPATPAAPTGSATLAVDPYAASSGDAILSALRERGWLPADNRTDLGARQVQSANGQFSLDGPKDIMVLDTPRTAGCFAPAGQTVETAALRIEVRDTDATVWVSSLDAQPITASARLLLAHLTDLQNTGATYAEADRQTLLAWGTLPHLVRTGSASVAIRRSGAGTPRAWALSTGGRRLEPLPVTAADGWVKLDLTVAGDAGARLMYEVVFE